MRVGFIELEGEWLGVRYSALHVAATICDIVICENVYAVRVKGIGECPESLIRHPEINVINIR